METIARPCPEVKPARKPRTVRPAHGSARLTLTVNGQSYAVRILAVQPGSGAVRLIRLRKDATTFYHVARLADGSLECDCPSFEFDHRQCDNGPCKHAAAAAAVGLI